LAVGIDTALVFVWTNVARTATEKRILERRRARGILVPILEETLEEQLDVEDEADREFMMNLMIARGRKREKGVFSPSMLSSCVRQAYFAKTGQEKRRAKSPRTNGYFLDGDFRHYKWQFALWKAHRAGLLILHGCEIRVFHPSGDFAGTIDAIVEIDGVLYVVDFKGMNVKAFQDHEKWGTKLGYKVQIVGYAEIVNKVCAFESFMGEVLGVKIETCLLIGESKGGPTQSGSPLALHEDALIVKQHRAKVKRRMHELRRYVTNEEIPAPDCTSTRTVQFQECPFAWFCRPEILTIQKSKERPVSERLVSQPPSGDNRNGGARTLPRSKRKRAG
jgi:hypothetical protein